jgi:hypothetical protein
MRQPDFYPDLRRRRADGLVAHILHIVEKYVGDRDDRNQCARELQELLWAAGVEIITDADRQAAGLPMRSTNGLTLQEMHILESRRIEAVLGTAPPMIVRSTSHE